MGQKLSQETKQLIERYLQAAANLYGIVPLSKVLSIYNSQNEPISEKDFLDAVDGDHKNFFILGEDEFYVDLETPTSINREIVSWDLLDDKGCENYYYLKGEQFSKPFYVPKKEKFLKFEDRLYHEKSLQFISMRAFFRNQPKLSKEKADEIAEDVYFVTDYSGGHLESVIQMLKDGYDFKFNEVSLKEFINLFSDMYNNMRIRENRGYTPAELAEL